MTHKIIKLATAWAERPLLAWLNSSTTKESALALAKMNAEQRRQLLRQAAINKRID